LEVNLRSGGAFFGFQANLFWRLEIYTYRPPIASILSDGKRRYIVIPSYFIFHCLRQIFSLIRTGIDDKKVILSR
jgi:hypothetical protein